ncbi:type II secretion system F family protein [Oscillospiraceae bacterium WX1]
MEVILLPALGAFTVYIMIIAFFGAGTADKKVSKRIKSLINQNDIDQIQDAVMREKRQNAKNKKTNAIISKKFEEELTASGISLNAREYLMIWICASTIPVLLLALLGKSFITIFSAGIIGFIVPPLLVKRAKKKRQQLFNKQLGETLVVMGNCMRSGYSFQQAMESIAKDMQPPISIEFSNTIREIRYGVKMEDALLNMVERTQNPDLSLLVSAVITTSRVGANLTDILDNISATIKDRIKIKDEVRVLTAQGRMSGLIIGLLPVFITLMLMLMNPGYIMAFFNSVLGQVMVGVGIFLEIIGFLSIRKIVDIKY